MDNNIKLIYIEYGFNASAQCKGKEYDLSFTTETDIDVIQEEFDEMRNDYFYSAVELAEAYSSHFPTFDGIDDDGEFNEEWYDEERDSYLGEICYADVRFFDETTDSDHFTDEQIERAERGEY